MSLSRRAMNQILLVNFLVATFGWWIFLSVVEFFGHYFSREIITGIMVSSAVLAFFGIIYYFITPKKNTPSHILLVLHILSILSVLLFFWVRAGVEGTMNSFF